MGTQIVINNGQTHISREINEESTKDLLEACVVILTLANQQL